MKFYRCDNGTCNKEMVGTGSFTREPAVKLSGITGTAGGILLPEQFHRKHFCSPNCFWEWVRKYDPGREHGK